MTKSAVAILAFALMHPMLSLASDKPADTGHKPASFVPHGHSNQHVYGAPIARPIAGRTRATAQKHTQKRRVSNAPKPKQ